MIKFGYASREYKMAEADDHQYYNTKDHLEPFVNPLQDAPFIEEIKGSYGTHWQFKGHVSTWTFGLSKFKNYVYLRYRAQGENLYHVRNINEKVTMIEDHQKDNIVIGLREVSDSGVERKYSHSIVINVNAYHAKFDLDNLIVLLQGSDMESMNEKFEKARYYPWGNSTAKSNATKLRMIF